MRGWSSSIGGVLLVAAAFWMLSQGGSNTTVFIFAAGALVLFYRGYQGLTISEAADDALLPASFVRDPHGTVVELASDRLHQAMQGTAAADVSADGPSIDVDAIMERYMAERAQKPVAEVARATPAARGFGRKRL